MYNRYIRFAIHVHVGVERVGLMIMGELGIAIKWRVRSKIWSNIHVRDGYIAIKGRGIVCACVCVCLSAFKINGYCACRVQIPTIRKVCFS